MSDDATSPDPKKPLAKTSLADRASNRPLPTRRSVIAECDYDEPPEKVWRALTDPELVAAWLLPNNIRPQQGARFTLKPEREGEGDIACEILAAEPPRLLSYSWREAPADREQPARRLESVVTFVLSETEDGGTHLRLVHSGEVWEAGACDQRGVESRAQAEASPLWPQVIGRNLPRRRPRQRPPTQRHTPIMMVARGARPATQRTARWAA
jgi:uncharacterized protein YndB with AHSA1/START domain